MIRRADHLETVLSAGRTASLQPLFEGRGLRLAMSDTNETVFRSALIRLLKRGGGRVVATDLVGEPVEWGAPE